jgi:hypothetical protein
MGEMKDSNSLYKRYPISSIFLYDGVTILHYLLGGLGITLAYSFVQLSYLIGMVYFSFALIQMYVLMPVIVCPSCVYHRIEEGRCISGLNKMSRRYIKEKPLEEFENRAKGFFSPNILYMGALILPIIVIIPGLIINFKYSTLGIMISIILLMLLRIFVIFPKIACVHCLARSQRS